MLQEKKELAIAKDHMGKTILKHFIYLQCQTEKECVWGTFGFSSLKKKKIILLSLIQNSYFFSQCVFLHLNAFIKHQMNVLLRSKLSFLIGKTQRDSSRNKFHSGTIILPKLLCAQTPVYSFMSALQVGWTQVMNFASYYFKCEEGILLLPLVFLYDNLCPRSPTQIQS